MPQVFTFLPFCTSPDGTNWTLQPVGSSWQPDMSGLYFGTPPPDVPAGAAYLQPWQLEWGDFVSSISGHVQHLVSAASFVGPNPQTATRLNNSADGTTWNDSPISTADEFYPRTAIGSVKGGTNIGSAPGFLYDFDTGATFGGGSASIYTSTDGVTFTRHTPLSFTGPDISVKVTRSLHYSSVSGLWIAGLGGQWATSADGINWVGHSASPWLNSQILAMDDNGSRLVAVGEQTATGGGPQTIAAYSDDGGATFTQSMVSASGSDTTTRWDDVVYAPGIGFVATGIDNNLNQRIGYGNGASWTLVDVSNIFASGGLDSVYGFPIGGITYSPSLGLLCVAGQDPFSDLNRFYTSPDAINWTGHDIPPTTLDPLFINRAIFGDVEWSPALGLFVACLVDYNITTVTGGWVLGGVMSEPASFPSTWFSGNVQ